MGWIGNERVIWTGHLLRTKQGRMWHMSIIPTQIRKCQQDSIMEKVPHIFLGKLAHLGASEMSAHEST